MCCASSVSARIWRSIACRSSSSFFASSCRFCIVRLLLRLIHRIARSLASLLQGARALLALPLLHVQREFPHHVLRLGHRAFRMVAHQPVVDSAQVHERAEITGEQVSLLHQTIERFQRLTAIVGMDAQALPSGDQQLGDRVVKRPFREFERGVSTGARLADSIMRDQPANNRAGQPRDGRSDRAG